MREFIRYRSLLVLVCGLLAELFAISIHATISTQQVSIVFEDVAAVAGVSPKLICGTPKKDYILEVSGSGVVWFDYNNDGYLDLYLVGGLRSKTSFIRGEHRNCLTTTCIETMEIALSPMSQQRLESLDGDGGTVPWQRI